MFVLRLASSLALVIGFLLGFLGLWACYSAVRTGPSITGKKIMIGGFRNLAIGCGLFSFDQLIRGDWVLTFAWMTFSATFALFVQYGHRVIRRDLARIRV